MENFLKLAMLFIFVSFQEAHELNGVIWAGEKVSAGDNRFFTSRRC